MIFENESDIWESIAGERISNVDALRRLKKSLFKSTECGISFDCRGEYALITGYAEGADAECETHELKFPFSKELFWETVKGADAEGCEMWHDWNDATEQSDERI